MAVAKEDLNSAQNKRPLSPHLQIYKPQTSSMLSIMHRMTGIGLFLGFIVFVLWLASLAFAPDFHADLVALLATIPGQILLFGWGWAVSFHICTGFRHLIWDMGYGFEIPSAKRSSLAVLFVSTALTIFVWLTALGVIL